MALQKIPTHETKYAQLLILVNEGKIAEVVREAKLWENSKMEKLTTKWPDRGKIFWELGQYCEAQEKLPEAIEFYREVGGDNYYEQASEREWKIAAWYCYLHHRGEIKLNNTDLFGYNSMRMTCNLKHDDERVKFLKAAYLVGGKPNLDKSFDDIRALLGLKPTPVYASPLSNRSTSSSAVAATPATVTTAQGISKQM